MTESRLGVRFAVVVGAVAVLASGAADLQPFGVEGVASTIPLAGTWRFRLDNARPDGTPSDFGKLFAKPGELTPDQERERRGYGLELGYHQPDFDDSAWATIRAPGGWGAQGFRRDGQNAYHGPAWYRQRVQVPAAWKGRPLQLCLGQPTQRGVVYWNGKEVARIDDWGPHFAVQLRPEQVRFDQPNTIAVCVSNFYREGGLTTGEFSLTAVGPFEPDPTFQPSTLPLSVDRDLAPDILGNPRWSHGWRDEGTSDTRPRLKRADGAFRGRDAIAMDIWYPNAAETVDCRLNDDETGAVWKARGFDYIAFHVQSDIAGEMMLKLNRGEVRWKKGGPSFGARFWIEAGDWKRVVLPFSAFLGKENPLTDTAPIDTLALGYSNHELRGSGTVRFAGFEVGHFALPPSARPVSLAGLWKFAPDNHRPDGAKSDFKIDRDRAGYGQELGWQRSDFDDSGWSAIRVGDAWEGQGYAGYDGPAWYRQQVRIPVAWKGHALRLQLGKPDDRGEVFWNGEEVLRVEKFGPDFDGILPPERVRYGELNTMAVRVHDWYKGGGLTSSPFLVGPEGESLRIRWQGQGQAEEKRFEEFEMGSRPRAESGVEIVVRLLGGLADRGALRFEYRLVDCFHATVKEGNVPITPSAGDGLEAILALDAAETRRLYYGEWVDVRGMVVAEDGTPAMSVVRHREKLQYKERDALALPALPETFEDTPMGRLRLVDVVEAGGDPATDEHPYKEGGVRDFWGGRRAYSPWQQGVVVQEFQGRRYREATNNQHFGYRIGRGAMKPGTQYLLRVLYPEDKTRYAAIDIKAGRNYQGVGFRTGVSPDDPVTPYPLSGNYEWCDHVVSLDDVTYGYQGRRTATSEHGFWVFFHDIGRVYAPQYDAGPAVSELRLYEIEDLEKACPRIAYPEGQPRRVLMMDWERQPEADPVDTARYARLVGLNALGPVILKWSFNGYFENSQGYDGAPEWFGTPVHRDGFGNTNCWRVLGEWLDATKASGVALVPRLEYGGSESLPKEARVIGRDGKVDPCGRYTPWGANLLHPATWEDAKTLLDEVVGRHIERYPNLGGVLWRMRSDRVKCSYGKQDVELFCKETGKEMPKGDAAALAKWAWQTMDKEYHDWWHAKRRDFHVRLCDHLRSFRPDLTLYYYNWDPDGWSLATGNNEGNNAQDWSDLYNVDRSRAWYERKIAVQKTLGDADYVRRFVEGQHPNVNEPHKQLRPELYRDVDGIALFAPVHWHYLSNNEPYIRLFETGDGLAVCNQYHYEEKGRTNVQGDDYETSEMTPAGPRFAMAEEVLSFFHGDPNVITWTPYTIGRSFVTEHRRFAQAFLALPDMRGEVVANAVAGKAVADVRVRTYKTGDGRTFVSVAHRGYAPASFAVSIPNIPDGAAVTDLVTGETVPTTAAKGTLTFTVNSRAMELNSYQINLR